MKNKNLKLKLLAASIGVLFAGTVSAQAVIDNGGAPADPVLNGQTVNLTGNLDLGDGGSVLISDGYTTYATSMSPGTFETVDLVTGAGVSITPGTIGIVDDSGNNTQLTGGNILTDGSITAAGTLDVNGIENNSAGITNTGEITGVTNITATGDISTTGTVTGATLTDGTASLSGGDLSGVGSISSTTITNSGNLTSHGINSTNGITNVGGLNSAGEAYINANSGEGDTAIGNSANTLTMNGSTVDVTAAGAATISGASSTLTLNGTDATLVNSTGHGVYVDATSTRITGGTTSTTLTLNDTGATFATDGGNTVVTGVADGSSQYDAVNYGQLMEVADQIVNLDQRFEEVEELASRGIASTAAMANIPQVEKDKTFSLGAGVGSYNGYGALAIGGSYRMAPNAVLKGSVARGGHGRTTYGVGAAVSW